MSTISLVLLGKDMASKIIGTVGSAVVSLGKAAAAIAIGGLALMGAALVKVTGYAVDLSSEFEDSMAVLSIAAKGSGETFETMHDAALEVGGDITLLGVSASGAASAMTGLYKAGLTTNEIFGDLQGYMAGTTDLGGALRASIDLAAASELDMVQASDLAATTLATFGSELVTEAERAAFLESSLDGIVRAADASVADVSDLADALVSAGPAAAMFGFSLEETANALALLSTRGIRGAEAGTALRSMMTNLNRDTAPVNEALTELGVNLYDNEGQMLSLSEIMAQFETAMVGMTEEQKNQYVQTLAGTYGMRAFSTLLSEGTEGWDAMALATQNASGIQEQAAARTNTLSGAQEALQGAIETLGIKSGEVLLGPLTDLTRWATGMVDEYGPMIVDWVDIAVEWMGEKLPEAIEWLGETFETVFPDAGSTLTDFWNDIKPGLEWLAEAFSGFITYLIPELAIAWDILAVGWDDIVELYNTSLQPALDSLAEALGIGEAEAENYGGAFGVLSGLFAQLVAAGAIEIVKMGIEGLAFALSAVSGAINFVRGVLDGLKREFNNIVGTIQNVKHWVDTLTGGFLGMKLPSWLTPGSPTPLETGLIGIGRAFSQLPSMDWLGSSPTMNLAGGAGGGGMVQINLHFGVDSVRSDQDIMRINEQFERALSLRGLGKVE